MIRVTRDGHVLKIDIETGSQWIPDEFGRDPNTRLEMRILYELADYLEKQTAAAPVDLSNWAGHYSINPAAVEALQSMLASTPAAPGIDLEQFRPLIKLGMTWGPGSSYRIAAESLADLIDASPKGVHAAPRFELTNGQIAQLADFAGMPMAGEPLEDQDVLVIQHSDAGHSGPGVYAHYDELPEEGAIYLDGQLPDSPKGGSDALARAYGYLWHVNHPEDIPAGHPFMSADRAAVEARKELRDMLTHEQRGEGINCVRQKLLADMQTTSHGAGVSE